MYNILHLTTGHFMYVTTLVSKNTLGNPVIASFNTKAAAGKAIEEYTAGKRVSAKSCIKHTAYVFPKDFIIITLSDTDSYIRYTQEYVTTSPTYMLSFIDQQLPLECRKRKLKKLKIEIPHKHEFLIVEAI